jgi:hypothetical protein
LPASTVNAAVDCGCADALQRQNNEMIADNIRSLEERVLNSDFLFHFFSFCLSSPHAFGGDPDGGLHLPEAKLKLRSGFATESHRNDEVFLSVFR